MIVDEAPVYGCGAEPIGDALQAPCPADALLLGVRLQPLLGIEGSHYT